MKQGVRSYCMRLLRRVRPMRKDYRKRFRMRLGQWLLYHQKHIVFDRCCWMGVRALKNPLDAWIYQEIVHEIQPDVIVEIGSAHGGSTLYFAHLLDIIGKGAVVSVDIDRKSYRAQHGRIVEVTGDSSSPDVVRKVSEICRDKTVLVFHDGDHSCEQVLRDLRNYSALVTKGSYFIVEDGIVDLFRAGDGLGMVSDGPLAAVEAFVKESGAFVVDADRERYLLTYNPRGYLKRVR